MRNWAQVNKIKLPVFDKNLFSFFALYLLGMVLMVLGYKRSYSVNDFIILMLAIVAWGAAYFYKIGVRGSLRLASYYWLLFFLFFPKQEMQAAGSAGLFNVGLSGNRFDIGFYGVLEFFTTAAVFFNLTKKYLYSPKIISFNAFILFSGAMFLVGLIHTIWQIAPNDATVLQIALNTMPFLNCALALIVLSSRHTKNYLDQILITFLWLGVFLIIEYAVVKIGFATEKTFFYTFNYRNAFKSIFTSSDLMLGVFSIACFSSALYFWASRREKRFLFLAFLLNIVVIESLNRSHWIPLAVAVTILSFLGRKPLWAIVYGVVLFTVMLPLSSRLCAYAPEVARSSLQKGVLINGSYHPGVRDISDGDSLTHYLAARDISDGESTKERLGAIFRGLDLVMQYPLLGVGPGNSISMMSNREVQSVIDISVLSDRSIHFYNLIRSGLHPTNSHNLFVHVISEFGVVGLCFVMVCIVLLIRMVLGILECKNKEMQQVLGCILICPLTLCGYWFFQASPLLSVVVFALFYSFALVLIRSNGEMLMKLHPFGDNKSRLGLAR